MAGNSFSARDRFTVDDLTYDVFRLDRLDGAARLPYSLKVLLENLLRNEDGTLVTAEQIAALGAWDPNAESGTEIQFPLARVLLQDFTGVPCVVDLVAMRDAADRPRRSRLRLRVLAGLGGQGHPAARGQSRAGDLLRTDPPRQPHRYGSTPLAVRARAVTAQPGPDR